MYIRHGRRSITPGIEKVGLYCPRCRRVEVEARETGQPGLEGAIKKYPVLEHVADVLKPYMPAVRGLYLHGSRVRGDYREDSDYDMVLISQDKIPDLKIELKKHNVQLECFTFKQAKKQLELEPSYLLTVLREGVPLIGADLQKQLLRKKVNDIALHVELDSCIKQLKQLKKAMREYELDGRFKSTILYSAIIRLRRAYEIKRIYNSKVPHLAEEFKKYYKGDFEHIFDSYKKARDIKIDNESDVPEEIKHMSKSMLKGLVNSVDRYIKDAYEELIDMLVEKLEQEEK
jgi:predicted nucleotidyltransferase